MKIRVIIIYCATFILLFFSQVSAEKKLSLSQRHFPNAPRISAKEALKLYMSGVKMVIIDIPFSDKEFNKSRICGTIKGSLNEKKLDRFMKKVPKNYVILSYCK